MYNDVKAKRVTATGSLAVGPARVRQLIILSNNVGAGRVTITDGNGGSTVLDLDVDQNDSMTLNLPDHGVRCVSDVYVSALTNITAMTVVYA